MIDLAFDPLKRDLILPPQPLNGAERVAQAITIHLRTWLGEWFLDATHGVPYMESILGKVRNPALIESILRNEILSVAGVRSIDSFTLNIDNRTRICNVQFVAMSDEGLAAGKLNINV